MALECIGYGEGRVTCGPSGGAGELVCQPFPEPAVHARLGEACGGTCQIETDSQYCSGAVQGEAVCFTNDGLYCAEATRSCEARIPLGDSCGSEILSCEDGSFCDGRRCSPLRGEGQSCIQEYACGSGETCRVPNPFACTPPLYCKTGPVPEPYCAARQADGGPCQSPVDCESSWCEFPCADSSCAGICGPRKRMFPEQCSGQLVTSESPMSSVSAAPTYHRWSPWRPR